jgi:hypothetical protein
MMWLLQRLQKRFVIGLREETDLNLGERDVERKI